MSTPIELLYQKRERLQLGLEIAKKAQFEAEGKMQSRYDTQKEDAAQDVAMYTALLKDVDMLIAILQELELENKSTDVDIVTVGRRICIEFDDGEVSEFLLLDKYGGVELGDFQTLSIQSPLGSAVLGKHEGDVVEIKRPFGLMKARIKRIY